MILVLPAFGLNVWLPGVAVILVCIGWASTMTYLITGVARETRKLVHMHEHADEYGFGTIAVRELMRTERERVDLMMKDHNRTQKMLVYYIKWWIKEISGKEPPPPLPEDID